SLRQTCQKFLGCRPPRRHRRLLDQLSLNPSKSQRGRPVSQAQLGGARPPNACLAVDDPGIDRAVLLGRGNTMAYLVSDQLVLSTKCRGDWCCAADRAGAVRAAIDSTLLRSAD
ncbi:hypothetical protein, partial [Bradyrhizobium zhanjiangense]|uniref:hypothetical protein n=1 Tax=Bradyrhizobium zhanjiangense TaxID=1325107 RepID=UPI0019D70C39